MKDALRAELRKLEGQSERLIELAADGGEATATVRVKLNQIAHKKGAIVEKLARTVERLTAGAERARTQLDLLENPGALYRGAADNVRRDLLGGIFTKLTVLLDEVGSPSLSGQRTVINAAVHELNARNRERVTPAETKRASRASAEGSLSVMLQTVDSSKGLNIHEVVGLVQLCSNNSSSGVDAMKLAVTCTESGEVPELEAYAARRRRWTRLSAADRAQIVERYEAGETSTVLSAEFGVAKSTILSVLRNSNVVVRRQPLTPIQVAEAATLYEAGLSLSRVAEELSLKQDTIRLALKAAGVELRPATGR